MATEEKERILVIVFGLPGSGKSYFARALAEKIGYAYLNTDVIRKEIIEKRNYSKEEKGSVYQEMLRRAEDHLTSGSPVIVDATFHKKEYREDFQEMAKKKSAKTVFIEIFADEDVIKERVAKNREYSEADFTVYKIIQAKFDDMKEGQRKIQSKRDNIQEMLDEAEKYLKETNEKG